MQVKTTQINLDKALDTVSRAISTRSTLPILSNVLVATESGRLKLRATNLEVSITTWIDAEVTAEGQIAVPARLFADFVGTLPAGGNVSLAVTGNKMKVSAGKTSADMHGMDAEDFPTIPSVSDAPLAKLDPTLLREMIGQVAFAAATDDSRPVLAGVLVKFEGGTLTMAAADGFRLAVKEQQVEPVDAPVSVIVPAKALIALSKLIGDSEDPVEIAVTANRNQVLFHAENVEIVSRLVDGNFPSYTQIVPKSHDTRTVVRTQQFLQAVRRAHIFARDNSNVVRLKVVPGDGNGTGDGQVNITATAAESGTGADELAARVEGAECEIAFNAKYLQDALTTVGTGEVALETQAPNTPATVKPVGVDGLVIVIMPMHLGR